MSRIGSMSPSKRYWAYGGVALLLAGAAIVAWSRLDDRAGENVPPLPATEALPAVAVVRTDISSGKPLPGTIGYGPARSLKTQGEAVITWLPAVGDVIRRGRQVYRVADRPVPLFYGDVPLYRPLDRPGIVGRDVRVIADNLKALGYSIGVRTTGGSQTKLSPTVIVHRDEAVMTESLMKAVKSWQRDQRLPETGVVGRGDVVVQRQAIRVASLSAQVGDVTGGELMTITSTAKVISVPAQVGDAGSVERGDTVSVTMPDGTKKPARVASIGTTATVDAGDPGAPPTLTITVELTRPADADRLDSATVDVDFTAEVRKGVLAVPVGALLALSEGGYAVQVSGGGLVPVRTGLIARGLVEVEGEGLSEGTRVVTTS
ncbi:efflux RND transporter periplasmic adaptor subunit [Micromonospora sp. NPDC018662]|uniref:efflux RND transporter periplasmic adaptor subunit n=1 Tax=Micromonospora sp. NPDC018662 TaxID=3364238 RepID=UPI0037AA614A